MNRKAHPSFRMVITDMFEWPLISHDYSTSNNLKMVQHRVIAYLQWPTNRKSYMLYRTAPLSMNLTTHTPCFKVTTFFRAKYLRNTTFRHSFNEILIGTYYSTVSFQLTLSDFEWLSNDASRGVSATAELVVNYRVAARFQLVSVRTKCHGTKYHRTKCPG